MLEEALEDMVLKDVWEQNVKRMEQDRLELLRLYKINRMKGPEQLREERLKRRKVA